MKSFNLIYWKIKKWNAFNFVLEKSKDLNEQQNWRKKNVQNCWLSSSLWASDSTLLCLISFLSRKLTNLFNWKKSLKFVQLHTFRIIFCFQITSIGYWIVLFVLVFFDEKTSSPWHKNTVRSIFFSTISWYNFRTIYWIQSSLKLKIIY